jgi:hypothetical protein
MDVLLICRPAPGVDPGSEFPPHLPAERDVLRALREQGALTAAYSPGGPSAVFVLDVPDFDGPAASATASPSPRPASSRSRSSRSNRWACSRAGRI